MSDTRAKSITGKWTDILADDRGRLYAVSVGNLKLLTTYKTIAAAGNYAANDVLSENATVGTAWRFQNATTKDGRGGTITRAHVILSKSGGITAITPRLTLMLFSGLPTSELRDNEANTALLHADRDNYIGRVDFPALAQIGGSSEAVCTPSTYGNLPIEFVLPAGLTDLYGILITLDAETNETASTVATIKLLVQQN